MIEGTMSPLLLRVEEAAEVLAIGRSKTYELIASGQLESVLIGGCRRVPTEALAAFVEHLREAEARTPAR
jgi:excisionase family DNA binding protein